MSIFLNQLKNAKSDKKLVLIASLPSNAPELAKVVLDSGADAVKIHINVHHHASNTNFGTLTQELKNIDEILKIWHGKPVGIVPFAQPSEDIKTLNELVQMGFDFLSLYMGHVITGTLPDSSKIARMLAISCDDSIDTFLGLNDLPIQICELSIMSSDTYGNPCTFQDLLKYSAVRARTELPLVVPSQHQIKPEAVDDLISIGIEGLMIGAVVAGKTHDSWNNVTRQFRKAIDSH